jgi:hypothetical protein
MRALGKNITQGAWVSDAFGKLFCYPAMLAVFCYSVVCTLSYLVMCNILRDLLTCHRGCPAGLHWLEVPATLYDWRLTVA